MNDCLLMTIKVVSLSIRPSAFETAQQMDLCSCETCVGTVQLGVSSSFWTNVGMVQLGVSGSFWTNYHANCSFQCGPIRRIRQLLEAYHVFIFVCT